MPAARVDDPTLSGEAGLWRVGSGCGDGFDGGLELRNTDRDSGRRGDCSRRLGHRTTEDCRTTSGLATENWKIGAASALGDG